MILHSSINLFFPVSGIPTLHLFFPLSGIRLAATRKFVPAGPLLALSVCALAVFISAYLQDGV